MSLLDSALALELNSDPMKGIVGAALRAVVPDTGKGSLPK